MPVFRAMQPRVHEQQYGGNYGQPLLGAPFQGMMPPGPTGGTGPVQPGQSPGMAGGAQNPAPGGNPYVAGTGYPGAGGTTAAQAFNPLEDPKASIYRAILARGLNPDAPTWGVNQLLKRANDIVYQLAARLGTSGQENVLTGGGFQDAVNSLIGSGGNVLSGRAEGQSLLGGLNSLVNSAVQGGGSEGARFLASILGPDVQSAASFAEALNYAGSAPNVRSALGAPLRNIRGRWDPFTETTAGAEMATKKSALDILLSGVLGSGTQGPQMTPGGGTGLGQFGR